MPKPSAAEAPIRPLAIGRPQVRVIVRSMSRSNHMLMAFAPPAASAPPRRVTTTRQVPGQPRAAMTIAANAVTSRRTMSRGLVSDR